MASSWTQIEAVRDAALEWLLHSRVRAPDGAYRSIYDPRARRYLDFYPMDSCMLSTAGAVVALGRTGHVEAALESAERVCELEVTDASPQRGAIRAGRNSDHLLSNWILFAVCALLEARRLGGSDRFVEVATRAADFLLRETQRRDGSFHQELRRGSRANALRRLLLPPHTWAANCAVALPALSDATGDPRYRAAAERHVAWLARLVPPRGPVPMYRHRPLTAAFAALRERRLEPLLAGCTLAHPTCLSYAIDALARFGRMEEAARLHAWQAARLSPKGLAYQYYQRDGGHSVEEDVMPTAHFGLVSLEHAQLGATPDLLERIAAGLAYAQIHSDDRDAHGALRGLPLHPEVGENAYTWDTLWSALFLDRLVARGGG